MLTVFQLRMACSKLNILMSTPGMVSNVYTSSYTYSIFIVYILATDSMNHIMYDSYQQNSCMAIQDSMVNMNPRAVLYGHATKY